MKSREIDVTDSVIEFSFSTPPRLRVIIQSVHLVHPVYPVKINFLTQSRKAPEKIFSIFSVPPSPCISLSVIKISFFVLRGEYKYHDAGRVRPCAHLRRLPISSAIRTDSGLVDFSAFRIAA